MASASVKPKVYVFYREGYNVRGESNEANRTAMERTNHDTSTKSGKEQKRGVRIQNMESFVKLIIQDSTAKTGLPYTLVESIVRRPWG